MEYYQMSFYETAAFYGAIASGVYGLAWIVARVLGRGQPV
jgi:hypothetical protein